MLKKTVITISVALLFISCTTTKWTLSEIYSTDERADREVVRQSKSLILNRKPTVQDPGISLRAVDIVEMQIPQKVRMERTVQTYKPKLVFALFAIAGSAITFYAANSGNVINSPSSTQKAGLNVSGSILALLSVLNLKPAGEPIKTGEYRFMRTSGFITQTDTIDTPQQVIDELSLTVTYRDSTIIKNRNFDFTGNIFELDLTSFFSARVVSGDEPGEVLISADYADQVFEFPVDIKNFLVPFVVVKSDSVALRTSPDSSELNVFTNLMQGNSFPFLSKVNDDWYEVQFGGTRTYLPAEEANIEWRSDTESPGFDLTTVREIPFGQIDVESNITPLKEPDPHDRAFILSSAGLASDNQDREVLERDIQLFESYMLRAFMMKPGQIYFNDRLDPVNIENTLNSVRDDSLNTAWVYISGKAALNKDDEIVLAIRDDGEVVPGQSLDSYFRNLASLQYNKLVILADLEYLSAEDLNGTDYTTPDPDRLEKLSGIITENRDNSVVIFSSRPSQRSVTFSGRGADDKQHRVFIYYWAEALQQGRSGLIDLVGYIQNNVDYTARRLFDRPQEIQVFGSIDLNLAE